MGRIDQLGLFFLLFGSVYAVLGWAAWTGRYRGWATRGLGYRALLGLPSGAGFVAWGAAIMLPENPVTGVLFGVGALAMLVAAILFVLTFFMKDRWYPRWYHDEPGHRW